MAKKPCFLYVDLAGLVGDEITSTLLTERESLNAQGFKVPAHAPDETWRAAIEMTRTHREAGLTRASVEGAWSHLGRRAYKGRKVPLLSVPGLGRCTPDQVDLAFDSLGGLKVHVIATIPEGQSAEPDIVARLDGWRKQLKPGRLFVIEVNPRSPLAWPHAFEEYATLAGVHLSRLTSAGRAA